MNKTDWQERDTIIFGEPVDWTKAIGGCKRFDAIGLDKLNKLVERDFIELEDAQNDAPTAGEIIDFIKQYPTVKAHGYVISPDRNDYRISLEGIECNGDISLELGKAFTDMFHDADDFVYDHGRLFCWYD